MDQILRVALVHDDEVGIQAELTVVDAQQAMRDGVKRSAPDPGRGAVANHLAGTANHLAGRPASKRQQQDLARVGSLLDEIGDAGSQGFRLARARPGNDAQGSRGMLGRGTLLAIERGQKGRIAVGGSRSHKWKPILRLSFFGVASARPFLESNEAGLILRGP